ncbi:hypothetical protein CHS0354_029308 [Potamilus streckersoni]|uniref:Uncharacterized protein n=1 Tax=Potamilus streckersoni TaxID=2493646 RepID=A0AAE0TEK7_9BIVA|nr:hypothetical protein CHS0354_029308 [Potamilus streckersoni]
MPEQEIIETFSPLSVNVVLAKEKNRSLCFFVDYVKLNNVTVKTSIPFLFMTDALSGSEYFCSKRNTKVEGRAKKRYCVTKREHLT